MARKNLLKGLMDEARTDGPEPEIEARVDAAKPRYSRGAIGAVSQSIAELKSRSVVDIEPRMIDDAGLPDRLDHEDEDHARLVESIATYGQQVPVLVRPNPNDPERYQVVYGRRRVAALKELGQPVKALVRVLDDREVILAQGQENTARKDLSYIEKANFARQMRDAGYDRKAIEDALHVDKTVVSRMLAVADAVPLRLIEAIGAAPSVGRDRWLALAGRLEGRDLSGHAVGENSDARFQAVFEAAKPAPAPAPAKPAPRAIRGADGAEIAQISRSGKSATIRVTPEAGEGFADWLADNLDRIHRDWANRSGE